MASLSVRDAFDIEEALPRHSGRPGQQGCPGLLLLLLTQLRSEMQYLHGQIEETDFRLIPGAYLRRT